MSASTEMPVDRLDAGTYTLRATIVEAAREIGSVSTPIRKTGLSTAAAK